MNNQVLSVYFKDLSNLLSSGIRLEQSLRTLGETALDEGVRKMCEDAIARLEKGVSFVSSLEVHGGLPREALMAIHAGEVSGELPKVFSTLGEYFELKCVVKQKIISAFGYPVLVILILLCVLLYISLEVIPKVAVLLPSEAMKAPLTSTLLSIAFFLKSWGVMVVIISLVSFAYISFLGRCYPERLKGAFSKIPFIGQMLKEQELSMGFFALYILQKSGVPLDVSLREAAKVAGGLTQQHFQECSSYIVGGLAFSEAVRLDSYFPRFTADTLRIGEESGRFEEYFERLYRIYFRMYQSRLDIFSGSIGPVMLDVSGGAIALIAIGFFQPLYGNLSNMGLK